MALLYARTRSFIPVSFMVLAIIPAAWYYGYRGTLVSITLISLTVPFFFVLVSRELTAAQAIAVTAGLLLILVVGLVIAYTARLRQTLEMELARSRQLQANLRQVVDFDPLTGVMSRYAINSAIQQALNRAARGRLRGFGVVFVDVDGMRMVNDTFGTEMGDVALRAVAEQLQQSLRSIDQLGRFSGDEFVILAQGVSTPRDCRRIAQRIVKAFESPLLVEGQEVRLTVSIGMARYEWGIASVGELIRDASLAMSTVKNASGNNFAIFQQEHRREVLDRYRALDVLHKAFDFERLLLHYQPIVDLQSDRVAGFECLLRLRQEDGRILPAAEFLPPAFGTSLMKDIDLWVLRYFSAELDSLEEKLAGRTQQPFFALNLGARSLTDEELVNELIRRYTGKAVKIEITESELMLDWGKCARAVRRLDEAGINLALDDFGTGFSSLNYLQNIPFDCLKIGREFLGEGLLSNAAARLYQGMISLAKEIRKPIIAEGVETKAQAERLKEMGVEMGQGYYFARPIPQVEALALLDE